MIPVAELLWINIAHPALTKYKQFNQCELFKNIGRKEIWLQSESLVTKWEFMLENVKLDTTEENGMKKSKNNEIRQTF